MEKPSVRHELIGAVTGAATGVGAGFIGVGGGEFRIPVLVSLLRFPLKLAGGINLVVGLFTVALGVVRRWGQSPITNDFLLLVGVMGGVSIVGASVGVHARERMPLRPLKAIVCAYLMIAGVWMVYESLSGAEHLLINPTGIVRWAVAALSGFLIAVLSGVLG